MYCHVAAGYPAPYQVLSISVDMKRMGTMTAAGSQEMLEKVRSHQAKNLVGGSVEQVAVADSRRSLND